MSVLILYYSTTPISAPRGVLIEFHFQTLLVPPLQILKTVYFGILYIFIYIVIDYK